VQDTTVVAYGTLKKK